MTPEQAADLRVWNHSMLDSIVADESKMRRLCARDHTSVAEVDRHVIDGGVSPEIVAQMHTAYWKQAQIRDRIDRSEGILLDSIIRSILH